MPLPTRVNPARAMTLAFALLMSAACAVGGSSAGQAGGSQTDGDWPAYGRDAGGERFSPLDAIHRGNVASLQVAWTFRTGDAYQPPKSRPTAFEATPLHVDGTLYLSTPLGRVIALDPVTGQQRWAFDAKVPRDAGYGDFASRGVSIWQRGDERRIFVATIDARLIALDARTGQPIPGFGDGGTSISEKGCASRRRGFADYQVTSPPAVIGDTIVVGSAIQDGATTTEPSGEVRGFDAITGRLKWSWDPIPQDPSAVGADTWRNGSATRTGAANAWSVIVADSGAQPRLRADQQPEPRLLRRRAARRQPLRQFRRRAARRHRRRASGTSRPSTTISGTTTSRRRRSCSTGARTAGQSPRWRRVEDGPPLRARSRDGQAAHSRRRTRGPEERCPGRGSVADAALPGGSARRSRARASKAEEAWGLTDEDRAWCRDTISKLRSDGFFTPPSLQGTHRRSRQRGRHGVGRHRARPGERSSVMPVNNLAAEVRLIPRDNVERGTQGGAARRRLRIAPRSAERRTRSCGGSCSGRKRFCPARRRRGARSPRSRRQPARSRGRCRSASSLAPRRSPTAHEWGSIALGGPIATAGGLVFTAGTLEAAIYAFDVQTGKQLWKGTLPTSARSTPMTYRGRDGRQYVVISAGGHGAQIGPPLGDYVVAFALPEAGRTK